MTVANYAKRPFRIRSLHLDDILAITNCELVMSDSQASGIDRLNKHRPFVVFDEGPFRRDALGYLNSSAGLCHYERMLVYAHEYPLGAMCHLVSRFPKDQIWTKVLVSVILLLDTSIALHVLWVFGFVLLNMDLIYLGLSPSVLGDNYLLTLCSHSTFPSLTGLVLSPTHGFFCWKICAVTKSKIIPVLVTRLSLDHAHCSFQLQLVMQ